MQLQFTPLVCALGGAVLGVCAVGKFAITGRILGISGALKGLVQNQVEAWRVLFCAGMVGGALVAAAITPGAFDVLPATFTTARAALGGLLVGIGAAAGNGCTSGHGICGNARLSPRSFIYTLAFMAAGVAAATLSQSAAAAGIAAAAPPLTWPSPEVANSGALLLASSLLVMLGLARWGQEAREKHAASLVTELLTGAWFAYALVYTGMVRPTKVIGFLSPLSGAWDLSLAFVMGGALLVATPGFQVLMKGSLLQQPFCETSFAAPVKRSIDAKLILGGLAFGAGWGLTGMCPGPAVVAAVAKPVPQVLAYCAAMMAGFFLQGAGERLLAQPKPNPKMA